MTRALLILAGFVLLAHSCSSSRKTYSETSKPGMEERLLDTLFVEAPKPSSLKKPEDFKLPRYNPSYKRENDLLHTRLDLSFDWENESVIGKAQLEFRPYFHPVQTLTLDAKGFEWKKVTFAGSGQELKYSYNGEQITIELDKVYSRDQTYSLLLEYIAHPASSGGSAAITSDQGLFFINPRGEEAEKPTQIWTQGETENNSRWFPTIDKPNERCTQELYLTVPARFKTLSNGNLISSIDHPDGTRTDYWRMDQPHAPYLFMIAVGEYAVVKDIWRGKELSYYVEPEYEASARDIFAHTPEMLEFFSDKLGVPYPWQKYAQVVVRDYVSGAMENTTAVIFGEYVQKHRRELIDNPNDKVVAHELFHHWFGDLVTCESWSNLTMNEGFANYSEYLWYEHKYGRDAADFHLYEEWHGYLGSSPNASHPLIHFGYDDKEQMFDAHSYNKGGSVLHMLRNYLGDEAFFSGLNRYLTKYAYQSVEAHNLRLAFEEVTGEDLNWFFNQWYFSQGHPELKIEYAYDEEKKEAVVTVEQIQNPDRNPPVFELPVALDIYAGGKTARIPVRINQRVQTLRVPVMQKPDLVNFDGDKMLLAEVQDNKTEGQLAFQFRNAPRLMDRFDALSRLMEAESDQLKTLLPLAVGDPFFVIRLMGLEYLEEKMVPDYAALLKKLALTDPHSEVRSAAIYKLADSNEQQSLEVAKKALVQDSAYNVMGVCLDLLFQNDPQTGLEYAKKLENEQSEDILNAIGAMYKEQGGASYLAFFEKNFQKVNAFNAFLFFGSYQELAFNSGEKYAMEATARLKEMALNASQSPWRRMAATKSLNDMRNAFRAKGNATKDPAARQALEEKVTEISRIIEEIKLFEPNEQLKASYQQLELITRA